MPGDARHSRSGEEQARREEGTWHTWRSGKQASVGLEQSKCGVMGRVEGSKGGGGKGYAQDGAGHCKDLGFYTE